VFVEKATSVSQIINGESVCKNVAITPAVRRVLESAPVTKDSQIWTLLNSAARKSNAEQMKDWTVMCVNVRQERAVSMASVWENAVERTRRQMKRVNVSAGRTTRDGQDTRETVFRFVDGTAVVLAVVNVFV